ncbi:MAG: hypothetical protein PVJ55_02540 [Anaerolineae bacterium]|jgi:hypothetical protein
MASYTAVTRAFGAWAEEGASLEAIGLDVNGEEITLYQVLDMLKASEDVMPSGVCDALGLVPGSTYADGVLAVAQRAREQAER